MGAGALDAVAIGGWSAVQASFRQVVGWLASPGGRLWRWDRQEPEPAAVLGWGSPGRLIAGSLLAILGFTCFFGGASGIAHYLADPPQWIELLSAHLPVPGFLSFIALPCLLFGFVGWTPTVLTRPRRAKPRSWLS